MFQWPLTLGGTESRILEITNRFCRVGLVCLVGSYLQHLKTNVLMYRCDPGPGHLAAVRVCSSPSLARGQGASLAAVAVKCRADL